MNETLSDIGPAKLKREANKFSPDDIYSKIIAAAKLDPTEMFNPARCQELAALKLTIPERIKTLRYARRQLALQIDDIKEEIRVKDISIALSIREEKDPVTSKPKYKSQASRESQELERRNKDTLYLGLLGKRRKMYSLLYGYDEEIEYLERIDNSLLEILALSVAQLESYSKHANAGQPSRGPTRNKRRTNPESLLPSHAGDRASESS